MNRQAKPSFSLKQAVLWSLRDFFAPLVGACKGIVAEMRKVDREIGLGR